MLPREVLIFTAFCFRLVSARSEYPNAKPRCHFQTISCACERHGTVANVTFKLCARLNLNELKKSVCSGKAALEKCKGASLAQGRQRRNVDSQNFHCVNGTVIPTTPSSPVNVGLPQVNINGRSRDLKQGEAATFRCTVVSTLPVNVTWLFNGRPMESNRRHSYLDCKTVLHITMLSTSDQGNYTCVVKNAHGQRTASSRLSVTPRDKSVYITYVGLENDRESNAAVIGSSVNLTCEAQNTAVYMSFTKDGDVITEGDGTHYTYYHTVNKEHNLAVTNLEIKNITLEDAGNYSCVALFNGFMKNTSFHLRVVPPDSELQKDEKSSLPHGISTDDLLGIVFGAIFATIIAAVALYCVAKRKQLLPSFYRRTNSTSHLNLQADLNGTCGNTDNVQNQGVLKRPAEVDYEVKYDVFICYSSKDITWVRELLAELENRHFTCCIDFKNFIPGAAIVENISQAIYHSRKTVAILSPDFVSSEWCNHELQKALTRIRSHQVIPIVYRVCEIPLILRDRTYLDWENCDVKPFFWEQLERSLKLPNDGDTCLDQGAAVDVVVS